MGSLWRSSNNMNKPQTEEHDPATLNRQNLNNTFSINSQGRTWDPV